MEFSACFTYLGADGIHVLHLCACVFHEDHSLTALQPVSISIENFFFALFSNSQRISPPFNQKVFATCWQRLFATSMKGHNLGGLRCAVSLCLSGRLSPS